MRGIMIDLETLDTSPAAAITQIGYAVFDDDLNVVESGNIHVDVQSCLAAGLRMNWDTVAWWMQQNQAARDLLTKTKNRVPLPAALSQLAETFQIHQPEEVWANSPSFDCVILQMASNGCGMDLPWKFWQQRDLRTIKEVARIDSTRATIEHSAESDAIAQVDTMRRALRVLTPAESF